MTEDINIVLTKDKLDMFFERCPELAQRFQEALMELQESGDADVELMLEVDYDSSE